MPKKAYSNWSKEELVREPKKVEFIRFKASDGVELQGWFSDCNGDVSVIHVHGMSGNGYENYFLDNLREMYNKKSLSFLTIDTRGRGIISSFWQGNKSDPFGEGTKLGGSCFEIFEESVHDIQGAIEFLRSRGKSKFILQGHSLGGSKVINYLVTQNIDDMIGTILITPTDMVEWAKSDPKHNEYLFKAKELNSLCKGEELVGAQCWLDKTPLSAQTYPTICEAGTAVDIYGPRKGGALLGKVEIPMLIVYGDNDIGIIKTDGAVEKLIKRINKIKNPHTDVLIIKGASHSFKTHEKQLAQKIEQFVSMMR